MSQKVKTHHLDTVIWDDIVMMILALASGYILLLQVTASVSAEETRILNFIDLGIAGIFLIEFFARLVLAPSKSDFFKHNWWYLLASIPVTSEATQALRLLRLLRLIRLFRLTTAVQAVDGKVKRFFKQTHILYVITIWAIIAFCGTILFYFFERSANANVHSVFDSLWYVMSTITTVGYGDVYPVTVAGRILGMVLMLVGIGTSGVLTALIASFFIRNKKE